MFICFRSFFSVLCDFGQSAIENAAKRVKRIGIDVFVLSEAIKLAGADAILLDQRIL